MKICLKNTLYLFYCMNYTLYMQNNTRVTVNYLLRNVVNLLCVITTSSKLLTHDKQVDVA